MTYSLQASNQSAKRRRRRGGRLALLAISSYGVLVIGRASAGCDDACGHDWQCDRGEICVPTDVYHQCVVAPTCLLDTDCDDGTRCKLRTRNLVNDEPRDPFTSEAPGRLTCGGYAGPPSRSDGCGTTVGNDTGGFGGSGKTSAATFSGSSTVTATGSFVSSTGATASTGEGTSSAGGSTASAGGSAATGATGSGP